MLVTQIQHYNIAISTTFAAQRSCQAQIHSSANALNVGLLIASFGTYIFGIFSDSHRVEVIVPTGQRNIQGTTGQIVDGH